MKLIEAIVMTVFGIVVTATGIMGNYANGIIFGSLLTIAGIGFIVASLIPEKDKKEEK